MKKYRYKICEELHKHKSLVNCPKCHAKIGLSYTEELQQKVDAVSKEDKQKILDVIWDGKTVGEAIDVIGIEHEIGFKIVADCIGDVKFLKRSV